MAYGTVLTDVVQSSTAGTPVQFNDGNGTQIGKLCRAWVQFAGSDGSVRASFNVGSVTKNGTGDYSINFTNAMPDTYYSFSCGGRESTSGAIRSDLVVEAYRSSTSIATTALRITTAFTDGTQYNAETVCASVFR